MRNREFQNQSKAITYCPESIHKAAMTAKEFFYLVAEMRAAQTAYFETRSRQVFRACRALENDVDREIRRVRSILNEPDPDYTKVEDEP
jgi:hypothetical protein